MSEERADRKNYLVVASRSAHKVKELRRMLGEHFGSGVLDLSEAEECFGLLVPDIEEDAPDFAGNAYKKAMVVAEAFSSWALADDSGLCVDALGGSPGVRSARYSGVEGEERDQANNDRLLNDMKDIPLEERTAFFVCAICLVSPDGQRLDAEGKCNGIITFDPRGEGGFGYDPLFQTKEFGPDDRRTHAELTPQEKDSVSHRGRAIRAMKELLEKKSVSA